MFLNVFSECFETRGIILLRVVDFLIFIIYFIFCFFFMTISNIVVFARNVFGNRVFLIKGVLF